MKKNIKLLIIALGSTALMMTGAVVAQQAQSPAPAFTIASPTGEISLAQYKGKVVYVDFWASWCGPCRQSFPWMNQMQAKYGAQGFQVIGVNVDEKQQDAQKFLAEIPAKFAIGFDSKKTVVKGYQVSAMPSSFLIDKSGNIIMVHKGFRKGDTAKIEAAIVQALK